MNAQRLLQEKEPQSKKMMPRKKAKKTDWTLEQYFEREYNAAKKHEFLNGEIKAMAYTSEEHGKIQSNLQGEIFVCVRNKECDIYGSDRMIYVPTCNRIYYPDLVLVCGEHQFHQYKKNMKATLNPSVLIEITSFSTESEDRIDKWACYKNIDSLQQYIIVSHRKKSVEIWSRVANNQWLYVEAKNDDDYIEIGDCKIQLNDIYRNVNL